MSFYFKIRKFLNGHPGFMRIRFNKSRFPTIDSGISKLQSFIGRSRRFNDHSTIDGLCNRLSFGVARNDKVRTIENLLSEGFERDLFLAAARNLEDLNNPLRAGNFAFPVRELLNEFVLVRLAPDAQVKACDWYVAELDVNGKEYPVSRNKRIKYSIQAGLPDDFLKEELGIDFVAQNKAVRDAIELLNKHTHVGPETFGLPPDQVEDFVDRILEAFLGFFDAALTCRTQTLEALADHLDDAVYSHAIQET